MMQQPEKETIIHIMPKIPRNKGNQTIKFGQLIGYAKSYSKCGGETIPSAYSKNSKLSMFQSQ